MPLPRVDDDNNKITLFGREVPMAYVLLAAAFGVGVLAFWILSKLLSSTVVWILLAAGAAYFIWRRVQRSS